MKRALPLLLVLFVTTASAAAAAAADKWTSVRSPNFLLVGNAGEDRIRDIAEKLELFRAAYSLFFPLQDRTSSVGTTVVVFKSDAAFRPYKPFYNGKPVNVSGYFQGGSDMNFIALSADSDTPRVIYHEYVHRLMADNLSSLPPWFQEGFAECFSTLELEGRNRTLRMGRAIPEHVALLHERRFMPLEQLFTVTRDSPEYNEQAKQGLFYAESWALVHYMMLGPSDRRQKFFDFLQSLNKGVPAPAVFENVFQTDLESFQKVFEAYIRQRTAWPAMELSRQSALDLNEDLVAKPLSEGESEFYLGNLLLHSDRLQDAASHLENAVRLEPRLAGAQDAMGRLLLKEGKETEAMDHLRHATELDPDNYLAHYYYASSIQSPNREQTGADWQVVRSELLKTIELAPEFVAATEMLANLNLSQDADIPQTVELLRKARTFAPGNNRLVVMLAFALAQTPEREAARPLAEEVLMDTSLSPAMRKNAENVLAFLDQVASADRLGRTVPVPTSLKTFPAGTARIRGTLTLLDCTDGLTLSLMVDGRTVRFHSSMPDEVRFTSANPDVASTMVCGPLPGAGVPAAVVYRPQESEDSLGEPLAVEFEKAAQ